MKKNNWMATRNRGLISFKPLGARSHWSDLLREGETTRLRVYLQQPLTAPRRKTLCLHKWEMNLTRMAKSLTGGSKASAASDPVRTWGVGPKTTRKTDRQRNLQIRQARRPTLKQWNGAFPSWSWSTFLTYGAANTVRLEYFLFVPKRNPQPANRRFPFTNITPD